MPSPEGGRLHTKPLASPVVMDWSESSWRPGWQFALSIQARIAPFVLFRHVLPDIQELMMQFLPT